MANPTRSIADHMLQESLYGDWNLSGNLCVRNATTAATVDSGAAIAQRYETSITVPTMTAPCVRAYCMGATMANTVAGSLTMVAETTLGTLTISGNSFASGSPMPSRKIATGTTPVQCYSVDPYLVTTAVLTAATPIAAATGEMLVTDPTKGLWQIVPNVERPYNLVYVPSINNVMAIRSLDELGDVEFQHIKVVK